MACAGFKIERRPIMLRVLFVGASTVNFGGAPGPWDHSRRLEEIGGVKASLRLPLLVREF